MVMVKVIRMGKKGDLSDLVVDAIPDIVTHGLKIVTRGYLVA